MLTFDQQQQRRHPRWRSLHRQQNPRRQRHFVRWWFSRSQRQCHWREQRVDIRFSIWFGLWRDFRQRIIGHRQQLFWQRFFQW